MSEAARLPTDLGAFDPRATYDAAAAAYEDASRAWWGVASTRTVARLGLAPGDRVLDLACGTGGSALAAAARVAPTGRVIGIDYSEGMLAIARDKARAAGADHLELRCADIARTPVPEAPFDAVVCVLGLFFVDDMAGLLRSMWRMVAPGGTLAVTVLGRSFLAPVYEPWRAAVAAERPGLAIAPPWQRTDDPPTVEGLFAEAGIAGGDVREESEPAPLARPEDWWRIVMGSALRRWITEIGPAAAARVRDHNLGWIRANGVDEVEISVIYARATRGPGAEDRS